jgi:uncharacterized membrane protein
MKSFLSFLRSTLTGGVLFLLPTVLLIILLNKARLIMLTVSKPLANRLPDLILGFDGSNLIAIGLLLIVCFVSGILFRSDRVRQGIGSLEENLLTYLPGYALIKSIAVDAVGDTADHKMTTVLVSEDTFWRIAYLVEEVGDLCTVFIPDAPRHDAGEVRIIPSNQVIRTNVTTGKAARSLQRYGRGAGEWLKNASS